MLGSDRRITRFITTGLSDGERERLGSLPTGRGILGVLIDEARPLRLHKLSDDPRSVGFPPNHPPMDSFLGVPVEGRGGVFGNLYLTEAADGDFTDEDERIVLLLAGMAAVAIENAQLYQDATEKAEQARRAAEARVALTNAAAAVLNEHDLLRAMRHVAREAVRLLRVKIVAVGVPDEFSGVVRYEIAEGPGAEEFDTSEIPLADSFPGSVLLAGVPIHVDGRDAEALRTFTTATRLLNHDVIAHPVLIGDEPVAVLLELVSKVGVESAGADDAAGEAEEALVDVAAALVADGESFEGVEPGEGALDDPAPATESGAVFGLAAGDAVTDPARSQQAAVLVVVVAAVGDDHHGAVTWSS